MWAWGYLKSDNSWQSAQSKSVNKNVKNGIKSSTKSVNSVAVDVIKNIDRKWERKLENNKTKKFTLNWEQLVIGVAEKCDQKSESNNVNSNSLCGLKVKKLRSIVWTVGSDRDQETWLRMGIETWKKFSLKIHPEVKTDKSQCDSTCDLK